jgi:hypothetical protein
MVSSESTANERATAEMAESTNITHSTAGQSAIVIVCPACGTILPDRYVMLTVRRAVCAACGEHFPIDTQLASPISPSRRPRTPVSLPDGLSHEPGPADMTVRWRWPRRRAAPVLFFAVIWSGFLAFWVFLIVTNESPKLNPLLLLHGAIAVFLLYLFLAYWLNSSWVELQTGRLQVRHGPIPWLGNRDLPTEWIGQLFSQMYQERGKRGRRRLATYRLKALMTDGSELLLLHNMATPEQALYLEQEIERYLGIADQSARGELPR